MRALIAAALLAASATAAAGSLPRDILGVELGEALVVPKCRFSFGAIKTACVDAGMNPRATHDPRATWFELRLPESRPELLGVPWILVIDGRVERVELMTRGLDWQHEVLANLVAKYGEPHEARSVQSQNSYGASFDVIEARWADDGLSVVFDGAFGSIRYGRVWVQTPAAAAFDAEADAAARAREPRL